MKNMLVYTNYTISADMPLPVMKCKRCKQEFAVLRTAQYFKSICFCPYCGQKAIAERKYDEEHYVDSLCEIYGTDGDCDKCPFCKGD